MFLWVNIQGNCTIDSLDNVDRMDILFDNTSELLNEKLGIDMLVDETILQTLPSQERIEAS